MTYVESFNNVWLCPHPWDERTELTRNMTRFYTEGAGHIREEWGFPDTSSNYLRIVMAAKYGTGYYRVVLSGVVSADTVNVFYIDFGNYANVNVADVRYLHKDFLDLPAQVVSARLWGVREPEGREAKARRALTRLTVGENYGFACTQVAGHDGDKPAVILQEVCRGTSVTLSLVQENQATLDTKDYNIAGHGGGDKAGMVATTAKVELNKKMEAEINMLRRDLEEANIQHERVLVALKDMHVDATTEVSEQADQLNKMKQKVENEKHEIMAAIDVLANEKVSLEKMDFSKRLQSSIVEAWQSLQKAMRNETQIEVVRPKLKTKQIDEDDCITSIPPTPAVLEEDQVEDVFGEECAEEEDADLINYPEPILPMLEFTILEEEKIKDAVIEVKTVEEKIGQSTSRYTLDKEIVHENDNLSSRKIVYENDNTVANDHVIQLPVLEKRVNVIDIEDEDDSDTEDYLPLKKMLSVWSQN